tara:strand:- start:76 stop:207 length:132 start_codon:yes stop_codon:yes gene_type:complete
MKAKVNKAENLINLNINDQMADKAMIVAQRNQMYSPVNYMSHP